MRESRTSGSVEGARGNSGSYSDNAEAVDAASASRPGSPTRPAKSRVVRCISVSRLAGIGSSEPFSDERWQVVGQDRLFDSRSPREPRGE